MFRSISPDCAIHSRCPAEWQRPILQDQTGKESTPAGPDDQESPPSDIGRSYTPSVEHKPETCTMMKHQNTLEKIIPYLLYGLICLISIAIMAFILWIHIRNLFG